MQVRAQGRVRCPTLGQNGDLVLDFAGLLAEPCGFAEFVPDGGTALALPLSRISLSDYVKCQAMGLFLTEGMQLLFRYCNTGAVLATVVHCERKVRSGFRYVDDAYILPVVAQAVADTALLHDAAMHWPLHENQVRRINELDTVGDCFTRTWLGLTMVEAVCGLAATLPKSGMHVEKALIDKVAETAVMLKLCSAAIQAVKNVLGGFSIYYFI